MIAIWQASHPAEKKSAAGRPAAHQPQLWHDEKSERKAREPSPVTRPKVPWDEFVQSRKAESA